MAKAPSYIYEKLTWPEINRAVKAKKVLVVPSRLAGYEDMNDAERLSHDPTFRLIGSEKIWERGAALTSRLQTFETEMLAEEENFTGLARINRDLIAAENRKPVLDEPPAAAGEDGW